MSEMENKQLYKLTTNSELIKDHPDEYYHIRKISSDDGSRWAMGSLARYTSAFVYDRMHDIREHLQDEKNVDECLLFEYNALVYSMLERELFDKSHIETLCSIVDKRLQMLDKSPREIAEIIHLPFTVLIRVCINNLVHARKNGFSADTVVGNDNLNYISGVFHQFNGAIACEAFQEMVIQWIYTAKSVIDVGMKNIISILSGFSQTPAPNRNIYNRFEPFMRISIDIVNIDSDIPIRMYADGLCADGMYQPGNMLPESANILARNMVYLLDHGVNVNVFTEAYRSALDECFSWEGEKGKEFRTKFKKAIVSYGLWVPFKFDEALKDDVAVSIVLQGIRDPRKLFQHFGYTEAVYEAYMEVLMTNPHFRLSFVNHYRGNIVRENEIDFLCWLIRHVDPLDDDRSRKVASIVADTKMVSNSLVFDAVKEKDAYFIRWVLALPLTHHDTNEHISCDNMRALIKRIESLGESSESVANVLHPVTHLSIISEKYLTPEGFVPRMFYGFLAENKARVSASCYDWYWEHIDHNAADRYSLYMAFPIKYLYESRFDEMKNNFDSSIIDIFEDIFGIDYVEEHYVIDLMTVIKTSKSRVILERYIDLILDDQEMFEVLKERVKSDELLMLFRDILDDIVDEFNTRGNTLCVSEDMLYRLIQLCIYNGIGWLDRPILVNSAKKRLSKEKFAELLRIDYEM